MKTIDVKKQAKLIGGVKKTEDKKIKKVSGK